MASQRDAKTSRLSCAVRHTIDSHAALFFKLIDGTESNYTWMVCGGRGRPLTKIPIIIATTTVAVGTDTTLRFVFATFSQIV